MAGPDLISVAEAIAIIDAMPVTPRVVRVGLGEAMGLRLAEEIRADRDYPPFDKSLMDGFAVRAGDVAGAPVELKVVGEIPAGAVAAEALRAGEAMRIMTGAPMPAGADGVVPVEETDLVPPDRVRILNGERPGRFITPRGADCAAGQVVLGRGTRLEAAQLAVAASVGAAEVAVYARPRVAVLSTGDEIVPFDHAPRPEQIRNSNNIMLVALLRRLGCDVTDLGIARDDPAIIRAAIERGLAFDALFVSGGMSMGQYDFVPRILLELGVELKITKLRIKPGKPFVFGVAGSGQQAAGSTEERSRFVFGLPGNPVSSFVCAVRLCARLLARIGGGDPDERRALSKLEMPLEKNGDREFYQPAVLSTDGATVRPLKWKGSADIYTLAAANGLIIRPENAPALAAGQTVDVLEIPS